jgi:hypothetical protein
MPLMGRDNPSFRVGNSLRKALPRLDQILPHREVADTVLKTILTSSTWPEKSLEQLVRAAKAMDSWTQADEEALHHSERTDYPDGRTSDAHSVHCDLTRDCVVAPAGKLIDLGR